MKKIVLCFDVDETVINAKSMELKLKFDGTDFIDFNGSDKNDDASAWINCLEELSEYCKMRSVQLIIQIISAKPNAFPDDTIYLVMSRLGKFLPILDREGNPVSQIFDTPVDEVLDFPNSYLYRTYLYNNKQRDNLCLSKNGIAFESAHETKDIDSQLLPPIHLCYGNAAGVSNKTLVMQCIAKFFNITQPQNIIFVDNDMGHLIRAARNYIQTISAASLVVSCESRAYKATRALKCQAVLRNLRACVVAQVDSISEFKSHAQPSIPLSITVPSTSNQVLQPTLTQGSPTSSTPGCLFAPNSPKLVAAKDPVQQDSPKSDIAAKSPTQESMGSGERLEI